MQIQPVYVQALSSMGQAQDMQALYRDSIVGQILSRLIRLGRIHPISFYHGQIKHHPKQPRELMQLDNTSVSFTKGITHKEFKATCPAR